jgi:flagellar basal body rod protein FlgB
MLKDLFGTQSVTYMLRGGLEEASATHRAIADRVAHAVDASSSVDFSKQLDAKSQAQQRADAADLQENMSALADTEIRYEADAKLLQVAYARLRTAIQDRV